jgi:steroid delta-isomerase-like uncharacterized protein
MTTDQNKKIIQRLFTEGICKRNLDVIDQLVDPNFINHGIPDAQRGPEGFKDIIRTFTDAFPDMDVSIESIIAEADMVATRGRWKATHQNQFMGIPATGKSVQVYYIDFWKVANGKCVENWVQMDFLSLMQQLGVVNETLEAE